MITLKSTKLNKDQQMTVMSRVPNYPGVQKMENDGKTLKVTFDTAQNADVFLRWTEQSIRETFVVE